MITDDKLSEVESYLTGTCNSLDEGTLETMGVPEEDRDPSAVESAIGQRGNIFLCSGCGWWCDSSEEHSGSDGPTCDDCTPDEEDEDEAPPEDEEPDDNGDDDVE